MNRYRTILKEAVAEQTIDKSRFIAHVKPVETKEEADAFIGEIRAKHKDAAHNVPAMVIGEKFQIQWASDDGEPQGTSGAPMVQMLVKEKLTNVVVVVTRYFGGIKLGTGGLVRAYTSSAKLGVVSAGICIVKEMTILSVKVDYTHLSKIQSISERENFAIKEILYEDVVILKLTADPENVASVKEILSEITAGSFVVTSERIELVKVVENCKKNAE